MFQFIVSSDLHFSTKIREDKADNLGIIKNLKSAPRTNIQAVICAGDLTEYGADGSSFLCYQYGGDEPQVQALQQQWIEPIESAGIPVYLCAGNHDEYVPWPYFYKPVHKLIKRKHGDLMYSFDIAGNAGINFVCLGKYPDKKALEFLRDAASKTRPNCIFFHYNLTGPYSDWWTEEEKNAFYNEISKYEILAIIVGHHHISHDTNWRGYRVISGSGSSVAVCTYMLWSGKLSVDFK